MGAQRFQKKRDGCGSKRTEPTDIAGTPWASDVVGLTLGGEMQLFKQFMVPRGEECAVRSTVRSAVQATIMRVSPKSTVKLCSEHGYGMAPFTKGIALVVEDVEDVQEAMSGLCNDFKESEVNIVSSDHLSLKIEDITTDVFFTQDTKSYHRALTSYLKKELRYHTNADLTAFVLTTILESCKIIDDNFKASTFLLIVLGYSKLQGETTQTPGEFLKGFVKYICESFNRKTHMVDVTRPEGIVPMLPGPMGAPFVVMDPIEGGNLLLGAPEQLLTKLTLTLKCCLSQMTCTESDLAGRVPTSRGPRSVLSTVIAYHEFWPRSFKFQRQEKYGSKYSSPSIPSSDDESSG
eukprot:TRINITY_DN30189_c0_g1_i1.p1 TRINITY_DN30189_c0_g1~~TRINITY_DN30189_c0_g1_i1.p1  ORF type:complete len:349 (+),score=102.88 TRINITY_DN30189_c0_g1_i1:67-1113(+)